MKDPLMGPETHTTEAEIRRNGETENLPSHRLTVSAIHRFIALSLALSIGLNPILSVAAPPNTPPPAAPTGTKEPLIEVSVDSLEISETNTNVLGILWGDVVNPGGNSINFLERNAPSSIFSIGPFDRARIAGQLDALIRNNQVRVLANPTLLTKTGFEANFLVGGEVPYPQVATPKSM
jgi:hypothetical protein